MGLTRRGRSSWGVLCVVSRIFQYRSLGAEGWETRAHSTFSRILSCRRLGAGACQALVIIFPWTGVLLHTLWGVNTKFSCSWSHLEDLSSLWLFADLSFPSPLCIDCVSSFSCVSSSLGISDQSLTQMCFLLLGSSFR